jgi:hypothetical protein
VFFYIALSLSSVRCLLGVDLVHSSLGIKSRTATQLRTIPRREVEAAKEREKKTKKRKEKEKRERSSVLSTVFERERDREKERKKISFLLSSRKS